MLGHQQRQQIGPVYSPEGKQLAYIVSRLSENSWEPENSTVACVVLNGRKQREYGGIKTRLAFSPDGKRLAYVAIGSWITGSDSVVMDRQCRCWPLACPEAKSKEIV